MSISSLLADVLDDGDPSSPVTTVAPRVPDTSVAPALTPFAPAVPAHLAGTDRRLWIIRSRIDATRTALARADVEPGGLGRISQLTGQLSDLLEQEAKLERDAMPLDPHAEEKRWQAAADRGVAKVRSGCKDARERMGALLGRPFPYAG